MMCTRVGMVLAASFARSPSVFADLASSSAEEVSFAAVSSEQLLVSQTVPSWCQYVPTPFQSAVCRGNTSSSCTCSSSCLQTMVESWRSNPDCCGCRAPQNMPAPVSSRSGHAAASVPAWCQYVPAPFQSVACRGSNASGCTCSSFCQETPVESWANNPECCACSESQNASAPSGRASGHASAGVPAWCHYVPAPFQSVACRGSNASGCTCSSFCQDTPVESWPNNPECCACSALQNSSAPSRGKPGHSGNSVPAWCQYVPAPFQSVACRGSNASGCTCSTFCQDTPVESWANIPECCACRPLRDTAVGSGKASAFLAPQQLTTKAAVPSWCQFVPTQFQGAACRGSSASGCTCASFCEDTPAESWANNPECCGCQGSKSAPSAGTGSGPGSMVATRSGN